jgi:TPP-dependent pyruvate/acetoin dehydrogenase alpha subunit
VGGNIPVAVGAALGFSLLGLDRVAVSFFGDGASNTGGFHEALNLAAVKRAPVLFVCENNLYAGPTHVSQATLIDDIATRAASYGLPGVVVDGMDVVAVYEATREAVGRAREGGGPTLLECKTYRLVGHTRNDPGHYRSAEEVREWRGRDPIQSIQSLLIREMGVQTAVLEGLDAECSARVEDAVTLAQRAHNPEPEQATGGVYAERGRAL